MRAADFSNASGPIELDQTNGGSAPGDGNLITVGGHVYTRGIGTSAPSSIRYYLGGSCSSLTTDVGVSTGDAASFTVYADDAVAASATVAAGDAPQTLTADLTGVNWLRLAATSAGTADADWAAPILTCGSGGPVQPVERTLFSFEGGTDGFTIANAGGGGSVETTGAFHTDGDSGLLVHTPVNGNWFGRALDAPLDLSGTSMLKFDMRVETAGSVGEIAVQVGDAFTWCQGGQWTWSNPGGSKTITRSFGDISCPAGVTLDPSDIRAVWVYLNTGGDVSIDNVRAE
ncbi:NPCBM/NEW2 domain-containing protein [Paractinoplanes durhamensis]|uniref:NPCBM/NEW2 domain-containing protein n=1 Tax=Paractinoplanes durhamensis TaxID=113563 RepID=UPI003627D3D8